MRNGNTRYLFWLQPSSFPYEKESLVSTPVLKSEFLADSLELDRILIHTVWLHIYVGNGFALFLHDQENKRSLFIVKFFFADVWCKQANEGVNELSRRKIFNWQKTPLGKCLFFWSWKFKRYLMFLLGN